MNLLRYLILISVLFQSSILFSQTLNNDDCSRAIRINDVTDWCSGIMEFTNVGATPTNFVNGTPCQSGDHADVWFVFTAVATDVTIIVQGAGLNGPEAMLILGCGGTQQILECQSDNGANDIIELYQGGLTVGQTYYLQVQGFNGSTGTFRLCFDNYFPPVEPGSDCITSSVLCDKSSFVVQSVVGAGDDISELDDALCFSNGVSVNNESNSTWFSWIAANDGDLTFTLTPLKEDDDLDFVLYELPLGVDDCTGKTALRCMASGDSTFPSRCMGPTGLASGENDTSEPAGCLQSSQSNFLAPLDMVQGTAYALAINNFTSAGTGFRIEFGGSGLFLGPQADFTVSPPLDNQCDIDIVTFEDVSNFNLGNIIGWSWNFGVGADPPSSNTQGPHTVLYESFGFKSIVLTIETDLGCIITESQEIFIEPCCDPANNLEILVDDLVDPNCPGESNGSVLLNAAGGSPDYEYSFDGIFFQSGASFAGLMEGDYELFVQDIKGCRDSTIVTLFDPPNLVVEAGPDITVNLGDTINLNGQLISPVGSQANPIWTTNTTGIILDSASYNTTVVPTQSGFYTLTATNSGGCFDSDSLRITVMIVRHIFIPNVFSPNDDGINDILYVQGGNSVLNIKEFRVFNRWGALMYENFDFKPNDESIGWDGIFKGEQMQPGVFAYYALVEFLDGRELVIEGDVTLVR